MIDGLTDGIWLMNNGDIPTQTVDETAFGIIGVGGGHRLDADRIIATQVDGSDMCHRRGTAGIIE